MRKNYEQALRTEIINLKSSLEKLVHQVYMTLEDPELSDGEALDAIYELIKPKVKPATVKEAEAKRKENKEC